MKFPRMVEDEKAKLKDSNPVDEPWYMEEYLLEEWLDKNLKVEEEQRTIKKPSLDLKL